MLKANSGGILASVIVATSTKPSRAAQKSTTLIAGVDEAGRGPLAGSVVAAAVILPPQHPIDGLMDSKQLSESQRDNLELEIKQHAIAWSVAQASVTEIDQINILHASMLAMQRAVQALPVTPGKALIDGNRCPELSCPCEAIVKGDSLVECISAASILAKVARDRMMYALHKLHPDYGFDRHKGYPTRAHFSALETFGVLAEHRRSFAPVRAALKTQR